MTIQWHLQVKQPDKQIRAKTHIMMFSDIPRALKSLPTRISRRENRLLQKQPPRQIWNVNTPFPPNAGLIYWDIRAGTGKLPEDGQQVEFHYIGYNENGRRVDSTYNSGQPARTRVGINGMIPGKQGQPIR